MLCSTVSLGHRALNNAHPFIFAHIHMGSVVVCNFKQVIFAKKQH